jgi:hypothetical protein
MHRRLMAARAPKNRRRRIAPLCGFSPPHFVGPGNATHFLFRAAKTSYTAGTLCAMGAKMV